MPDIDSIFVCRRGISMKTTCLQINLSLKVRNSCEIKSMSGNPYFYVGFDIFYGKKVE
jgi:hypothetical protein